MGRMTNMMLAKWAVILVILIAVSGRGGIWADDRTEPVDIMIVLDKSLSMEEEISAVKEYVNTRIVDQVLQNGDFFLIVAFFGKTKIIISDFIKGEEHKEEIKRAITQIKPDGDFTDIGNALDVLKEEVEKRSNNQRQKTLLLITDGKNEPHPASKYYTEDGTVSHAYLETASETQKEGWKIVVLGLGTESAREIAEDLAADYSETDEDLTTEELDEALPDLTGVITVVEEKILPVSSTGKSKLVLTLETKLYSKPPEIVIDSIGLLVEGRSRQELLAETYKTALPQEGLKEIHIPLLFERKVEAGHYEGKLSFKFGSKEHFDTELAAFFRVKSLIQTYLYLILPVGLLLLIGAVIIFLTIGKVSGKTRISFRLIVEEHPLPKGKDTFTARSKVDIFLNESMDAFGISEKKNPKTISKLSVTRDGLAMTVIKEDRFPELKSAPKNVIDHEYIIRTESGKDFHVHFTRTG